MKKEKTKKTGVHKILISFWAVLVMVTIVITTLASCENIKKTVPGVSNQFDLKEEKEYWTGSIDDDFLDDRVCVIMKKTTTYPELDIKVFRLKNAESLHYSFLAPTVENPDFHQMLVIYLKEKGKDQVISAINHLKQFDFIMYVGPENIFRAEDD